MRSDNKSLPYLVLFTGILFLSLLLSLVKPGIFYSGDGGIKFLEVEQVSRTGSFEPLQTPHPRWVQQIWNEGYYPVKTPFIYNTSHGRVVSFPVAFQYLSSFPYKWFGLG